MIGVIGGIIIFFSSGLVLGGLVIHFMMRGQRHEAQRILETPTSPIASAPGGGVVEIRGQVVESEQGAVCSTLTGRKGVYCRTAILAYHRNRSNRLVAHEIYCEKQVHDFFLDDGSGQRARLQPKAAGLYGDPATVGAALDRHSPSTLTNEMRAWAQARLRQPAPQHLGLTEHLIVPGQTLYAIGPSARHPGAHGQSELVLYGDGDGKDGFVLSTFGQQELLAKLGTTSNLGRVIFCVDLGLVLTGVVMIAVQWIG